MNVQIPLDPEYTRLVGTAVYAFSYYEWTIIYIIERLSPGFVSEYSRQKRMTSGHVEKRLEALSKDPGARDVDTDALVRCSTDFSSLVPRRNALIHAHPITDSPSGDQLLNFQSLPSAPITDMKWTADAVECFIGEVDEAAIRAGRLLRGLKPSAGA